MAPAIDLSIVTINWNVAELLRHCLASIYQSPVRISDGEQILTHADTTWPIVEMIVVDSASTDHSLKMVREDFPWVQVIACQDNIGFVRGNNLGMEATHGKAIFLLNPDTEILGDAIPQLLDVLYSAATIGAVGPHTLNTDGSHQSTRRNFPTFWTAIFESTWLESVAPQRILTTFRVLDKPDDGVYAVGWVQGSALMFKREVYEQIGGLDTRYIMYSEELDWCKRAVDAGWQVMYVGTAQIIHHHDQSASQVKTRKHIHFQHSKLRYFRKFHGRGVALILRLILALNYGVQLVVEGTKWLVGHKRPLRAERITTYWAVLRSLLWAGEGQTS